MIDRLDDGLSSFFVHIDKNAATSMDIEMFENKKNIELLPGVKTQWGSFGLVMATLNAMGEVSKRGSDFERTILLSGQDYPVKSNDYINHFLSSSAHSVFMDSFLLPNYDKWPSDGGNYRVNKYFFGYSFFLRFGAKALNFFSSHIFQLQRKVKNKIQHFYGSQWWIIDGYALNYILTYVKNNPGYTAFHKFTFAPDELFFQTILMNSKDEKLLKTISNDNKRFMKWTDALSANPETLTSENFGEIKNSPALFARKFDSNIDGDVLTMIDENILEIIIK